MEENEGQDKVPATEEKATVEAVEANPEQDLVGEAKKAAAEIKAGLAEREKILAREEKLVARQEALRQLGGGSMAGSRPIPKEETPAEYRDRVLKEGYKK